jgi:uncharacterized membrane protein YbaN (DUF454 family)
MESESVDERRARYDRNKPARSTLDTICPKDKREMAKAETDQTADDDNNVALWEREESPLLTLRISECLELTLRQYPSKDERWGIHSCVWDGGIATLAYLMQSLDQCANHTVTPLYQSNHQVLLLDLGSGTGIVGLGLAQLAPSWLRRVYLTDLAEAVPLLETNIQLNQHHFRPLAGQRPLPSVQAVALNWTDADNSSNASSSGDTNHFLTEDLKRHLLTAQDVLLIGADIIYQPALFQPLLKTLFCIKEMVISSKSSSSFRVLLGSHSIRTYHDEFWEQARAIGFQVKYKASVHVEIDMTTETIPISTSSNNTSDGEMKTRNICSPSNVQISIPTGDEMEAEGAPVHPLLTTIVELY